jgi:NADH:ubiquinone oxidoreductase subunit F (NADH-binding)/NADH:ubiquinone oxidoreductase subunit E
MIVQALHEIQDEHGYLPKSELKSLAARTGVPLYRLQEVASFFPHFRLGDQPPPPISVKVCRDMACHLRGAPALQRQLESAFAELPDGRAEVSGISCLGRCDRAPAVLINEGICTRGIDGLREILRRMATGEKVVLDPDAGQPLVDSRPWQIDVYGGRPSYQAARDYLATPDPSRLIESLKTADLRGMGGAGVPAHQKWNDVYQAEGSQKYIVCNADESEPGTFKDREILLRMPHLVVEGVALAGLLTGAERGYIFIRHEYPEEAAAIEAAIREAEKQGALGKRPAGSKRSLSIEVFISPGGYICGEQSALLEAMEDRRAEPRNRPPQLETNGLYDKPTLVSNVETFAWVPGIFLKGGYWYRDLGVNGCKGARLFSICGDVARPGVYEVPNGLPLRDLLALAGGIRDGKQLKAFAPSGPSGGFLPTEIPVDTLAAGFEKRLPEAFLQGRSPGPTIDVTDLWLDLQFFRDLGLMLGAGLAVYAEGTDMLEQALNCLEFFRNESCGKCVPCRLGSQKLVEIGTDLGASAYDRTKLKGVEELVRELAATMTLTSICGLGTVAANPLTTLLQYFHDDVDRHLANGAEMQSGSRGQQTR